jgi:hypothetical protein
MILFERDVPEIVGQRSDRKYLHDTFSSNLFDKPPKPVIEAGILLSGKRFPAWVKANKHLSRRIRP